MSKSKNQDTVDTSCVVCCRDVQIYAIGNCDHPVCYDCATRMRVLANKKECPICRRELPKVIYVGKQKPYATIARAKYPRQDVAHQLCFENSEVEEAHHKLLEHRCKMCKDQPPFADFNLLKDHMRKEHDMHYCELCVANLMIFTHERKHYSRGDLARHRRIGDAQDSSHRGHPLCEFCDDRFLDNDALYRHLRREHYFCHFCDADGLHHYYSDYEYLRNHFRAMHYLCELDACWEEKFVSAFRSSIDLKAHQTEMHNRHMTKAQAKQTRTLDLEFALRPRAQMSSGAMGRGGASASGANNDGDAEPYGRRGHLAEQGVHGNDHPNPAPFPTGRDANPVVSSKPAAAAASAASEIARNSKNFPKLGESAYVSGGGSNHSVDTLARKLARINRLDIGSSSTMNRDFPALGTKGDADGPSRPRSQRASSVWAKSGNASVSLSSSSRMPAPTSSGVTTKNKLTVKLNSKEDFPGLASKAASAKGRQPSVSVQVSHKQKVVPNGTAALGASQQSASWPIVTKVTTSPNITMLNPPAAATARPSSRAQPLQLEFRDDVTRTDNGWYVLNKKGKKVGPDVKPSGGKQNGNDKVNLLDHGEFPALEAKSKSAALVLAREKPSAGSGGASAAQDTPPLYDTVKINLKKKKQKDSTMDNNNNDDDEAGSLLVLRNDQNGLPEPSKKKKKQPSPPATSCENEENEVPRSAGTNRSPKRTVLRSEPGGERSSPSNESTAATMSSVSNDYFNATSHGDFPRLPASAPVQRLKAPPGFNTVVTPPSAAPVSGPPPGFVLAAKKVSKPPPGFDASTAVSLATFTNSNGQKYTYPMAVYQYVPPTAFQDRNRQLMENLLDVLSDDREKFAEFRSLSGSFRKGGATAASYYRRCGDIMGKDKFANIFPELLVLLPDIAKQQQLLAVHNRESSKSKSSKRPEANSQLLVCATCQQVLSGFDFGLHMNQHSLDADFPALPGANLVPQATWVKRN